MIEQAIETMTRLRVALSSIIRGRDDTLNLVLTGLLSGGHVLLEDYPGSGKTTLAKALGKLIDCSDQPPGMNLAAFRRIQFTPDLLPSDVLGVNIFEPKSATFQFQHGPIFAHIILADEINRTGPKVQSAFLECMAERQVTIDNTTYPLDDLFFVIGTQNPLDLAGTYPLPLVQLDRFLLRIPMRYVDAVTELEIVKSAEDIEKQLVALVPVVQRAEILSARAALKDVLIHEAILEAIVDLVQATRRDGLFQFGASTRAAIMLKRALGGLAIVRGRNYVNDDDFKFILPFVLQHRLRPHPGAGNAELAFEDFTLPFVEKVIRAAS